MTGGFLCERQRQHLESEAAGCLSGDSGALSISSIKLKQKPARLQLRVNGNAMNPGRHGDRDQRRSRRSDRLPLELSLAFDPLGIVSLLSVTEVDARPKGSLRRRRDDMPPRGEIWSLFDSRESLISTFASVLPGTVQLSQTAACGCEPADRIKRVARRRRGNKVANIRIRVRL